MACQFDEFLLHEYLDGTIGPLEKIFLEEHLQQCRACRKELTSLKLVMWELEGLADEVEVPADLEVLRDGVLDVLMADEQTKPFGLADFLAVQKNIWRQAGSFLDCVPGLKPGAELMGKGLENSRPLLGRALKGLLRGDGKLAVLRLKA